MALDIYKSFSLSLPLFLFLFRPKGVYTLFFKFAREMFPFKRKTQTILNFSGFWIFQHFQVKHNTIYCQSNRPSHQTQTITKRTHTHSHLLQLISFVADVARCFKIIVSKIIQSTFVARDISKTLLSLFLFEWAVEWKASVMATILAFTRKFDGIWWFGISTSSNEN